ncbi:MAG: type II toxin-antitoxin system VapC family toxin [Planctomycetota bacterium]|jgi:PIN domain nuclease of toxin-antitoxin system|nr:type II toxin-antitoxin system VapC family toxin [Planctomycetota bacterium]
MRPLLDAQTLIRAAAQPESLPKKAMRLIGDLENELFFSPASLWEAAIKNGPSKPNFNFDARILRRGLLDNGYQELTISSPHAVGVSDLPNIHKDPFDRLLLAQAKAEGILLLTSDNILSEYPVPIEFIKRRPRNC